MQRLINAFSGSNPRSTDPHASTVDAQGMVHPSSGMRAALQRDWHSANEVGANELARNRTSDGSDPRAAARRRAVSNTCQFYPMRVDPRPNATCVAVDCFDRITQRDHVALRRQISFISVVDQLNDIDVLTRPAVDGSAAYIDAATRSVLEESLKTVKLASLVSQQAACIRARAGERALPLSLDSVRMRSCLADNEAQLAQVVQACDGGFGEGARLKEPIHALVTDYLRRNHQLPYGLLPTFDTQFRGQPITEPVTVFAGTFPDTTMEYEKSATRIHDALVLSIGSDVLAGPLENHGHLIARFHAHPPAQQRAAFVLQSLFHLLTSTEEVIRTQGLHARSEKERRENSGTEAEWGYEGSQRLGDATTPDRDGSSQRARALAPLAQLPARHARHRAAHGLGLVTDPKLVDWIASGMLGDDLQTLAMMHPRLAAAQAPTTAAALLETRAFGGSGIQ